MPRKLFSINTTESRDGLVLPGHDRPDYAEYLYVDTTVIWGDGTEKTVQKELIDPEFDVTDPLNRNIIHLGIDLENDREYFSCRSEIDTTNLGSADADALEWAEETFPLSEEVTLRLISRIDENGNQVPDLYEQMVKEYKPNDVEAYHHQEGNTAIQRIDDLGYTIPSEWKENLIAYWDRPRGSNKANTVVETANTESANTGA